MRREDLLVGCRRLIYSYAAVCVATKHMLQDSGRLVDTQRQHRWDL